MPVVSTGVLRCYPILALFLFALCSNEARAENVALFRSLAGNLDFTSAGGTFRTSDADACAIDSSASAALPALPAQPNPADNPTVREAYLYYAASANAVGFADDQVALTLNGSVLNLTADRTFTTVFPFNGTDYPFYGGFRDITAFVQDNISDPGEAGTVSLAGLDVNDGAPHCDVSAVVGGFAVVVIYEGENEDFRVVNIFDGFQFFRGSQVTLTPDNFVIPPSPINGKQLVISWEGDAGNSGALGGFNEQLTFNGTALPDGGSDSFNPPGTNPVNNQFNGTVTGDLAPQTNVFGVDIDTYDITFALASGDTSGSTVYSSGGDLVILGAEVISVSNTPVSDLGILKTSSGSFQAGATGAYTLSVENFGPNDETGSATVTDDLSGTGLSFVSAAGTGWTCGEASEIVTCTRAGLAVGAAPDITLTVAVDGGVGPSVSNTASVAGTNFDNVAGNNSADEVTAIDAIDLSPSSKSVVDLDGGLVEQGDTLEYTITVRNDTAFDATNITVTDTLDGSLDGGSFAVQSAGGGTSNYAQPVWTVTGLSVPAGTSVDLTFTVDVAASAGNVSNQAGIETNGVAISVDAPTLIVGEPIPGNKPLYLLTTDISGVTNDQPVGVERVAPNISNAGGTRIRLNGVGDFDDFPFTINGVASGLPGELVLDGNDFAAKLFVRSVGNSTGSPRTVTAEVYRSTNLMSAIASGSVTGDFSSPDNNSPVPITITLEMVPPGVPQTFDPLSGENLVLRLTNESGPGPNRRVLVFARTAAGTTLEDHSRLVLSASSVISVDSADAFAAPLPDSTPVEVVSPGEAISLRAVVSDPFGAQDITGVTIEIFDADGVQVQPPAAMTAAAGADTDPTKTFEFPFTPNPASPLLAVGDWTFEVIAEEGAEGLVEDTFAGSFELGLPDFLIMKSSPGVISDPVNGGSNPKRLPGAVVSYEIQVSNQGRGRADEDSVVVTDNLPGALALGVADGGADPIGFADGGVASGLTFDYATDVAFTLSSGTAPTDADADGCFDNVTGFTVTPSGRMNGAAPPVPTFTLSYRACIE